MLSYFEEKNTRGEKPWDLSWSTQAMLIYREFDI